MTSKIDPPKFINDASEYPEYRRMLLRWSRITKVKPEQQAEVVLYHLQGHSSGIQSKIDTALGDAVENEVDGLTKVIEYMDTIYKEDEMTEAWTKYKQFIRLKKELNQPVTEFIAEFDKAHTKAQQSGCEFSDIVLGFNLLESCNLNETDEKFILTAVNFKEGREKKNLLEQIKGSLRKFHSRERLTFNKEHNLAQVKQEDLYVTSIKQALVADGWKPPTRGRGGSRRGRGGSRSVKQNSPLYKGHKNPLGPDGNPLTCFKCNSEYHMADMCDKKEQKPKEEETALAQVLASYSATEFGMVCQVFDETDTKENLELVLVSYSEKELCLLIEEAGCRGVLDSACSKSVAGMAWIKKYTMSISATFADSLVLKHSSKVYQFGGGEVRKSKGLLTLPTIIGEKKINITVEVVDAPIPLLIGANSLKAGKAILDFHKFKATFFEETVEMIELETGHFCVELCSPYVETYINNVEQRLETVQKVLLAESEVDVKMLKKLHHYYGHTQPERLLKFLENAGKDISTLRKPLMKIEKSCEACQRTKRSVPKPKSAIPRVTDPNAIVSIDLKEWTHQGKKRYICYLIDLHSRLTLGSFINNKEPDSIVKCIMNTWVPVFGLMAGLHSDLGGEFSNDVLQEVASQLGINISTTAAYSPHQNGLNERNHAVVDMMITRMILSDPKLSPEMALLWALNAKNSLENCYGFSPFQLHIGKNPMLPSTTRDGPPAYEDITKSKSFATHLSAMHSAREQFIKAESSASLKKALKSKVYPKGGDIVEGDEIYFKHNKDKVWSGPSKVVAVNGKKLFVDNGGRLKTVNRDDSVRKGEEMWNRSEEKELNDQEMETSIRKALRQVSKGSMNTAGSFNTDSDETESESETEDEGNEDEPEIEDQYLDDIEEEDELEQEYEVEDQEDIEGNEYEPEIEDEHYDDIEEEDKLEPEIEDEDHIVDTENEIEDEELTIIEDESQDEQEHEDEHKEETANEVVESLVDSNEEAVAERNENQDIQIENQVQEVEDEDKDREFNEEKDEELSNGENTGDDSDDDDEFQTVEEGDDEDSSSESTNVEIPELATEELAALNEDHQEFKGIKKNDIIQYNIPETNVQETSKVLSRAAKSSGPNRNWWNVEVIDTGETKAVNTAAVGGLQRVDCFQSEVLSSLVVTIPRNLHGEPDCVEAKEKELVKWEQFGVYQEVPYNGEHLINTNWVLVRKDGGVKARLCIRGDQELEKEKIRTDSPTINKVNIKLFYVMAVHFGWHVRTADIKAAFLQGANLDRDVFVRPPKERRVDGVVWKMIKRAYGFVDASRGFYLELKKVLEELGCVVSLYDPALFIYFGNHSSLQGLLLAHVDDLIHGAGTKEFDENILNPLKQRFTFGREEENDFKYVGIHVKQYASSIVTDQDVYVEDLDIPYSTPSASNLDDLLDDEGQSEFRTAVGRIGWVANSSRPDLAYDHLTLSMKVGKATVRDMKAATKAVKKIKYEKTTMKFVNLGSCDHWVLQAYGDAGFKSLPDKLSSCSGYVVLLTNQENNTSSILSWKCNKIRRVVDSSTAAEALASNDTLDALVYIKCVLNELLGDLIKNIPLQVFTDSRNLHRNVHTTLLVENPRLRTDIAKLKQSLERKELNTFELIRGKDMIADVLTKKGASGAKIMNILRTGTTVVTES